MFVSVHLEYYFTNHNADFIVSVGRKKRSYPTNIVITSTKSVSSPEMQSVLTRIMLDEILASHKLVGVVPLQLDQDLSQHVSFKEF